jgi:hypothetical protein
MRRLTPAFQASIGSRDTEMDQNTQHVYPVRDEIKHTLGSPWECRCEPEVDLVRNDSGRVIGRVVIHQRLKDNARRTRSRTANRP